MNNEKKITGIMFYYFFVCKRKLWYFSNGIQMESENENVILGKLLDENSYKKSKKHIMINETINIDFIEDWEIIHEIKKSPAIEESSIWQIKYYIYYLKKHGIKGLKGLLDYPLLKKRVNVELTEEDEIEIEKILLEIEIIVESEKVPDKIKSKICKKCAYYELCYV